jgi:hypothetical protein
MNKTTPQTSPTRSGASSQRLKNIKLWMPRPFGRHIVILRSTIRYAPDA